MGTQCWYQNTFELSVSNPDKPSLEKSIICSRLSQFTGKTIIVTNASLFWQKAKIIPSTTFVVGHGC